MYKDNINTGGILNNVYIINTEGILNNVHI